jgi:hypothetical protein
VTFSVTHHGRGGHIRCDLGGVQVDLPIEMVAGGDFSVWLRGAAIQRDRRAGLVTALRAWLDTSGRPGWVIEE